VQGFVAAMIAVGLPPLVACGGNEGGSAADAEVEGGSDGGGGGGDGAEDLDSGNPYTGDGLDTALGCEGVFNPDQILDYYLDLPESDWRALLADTTNSVYFAAELRCGGSAPITVGVRRKRSGGAEKVGLKVDINYVDSTQTFYGLRKLSFENGVSEGETEDGAEVAAYLAEYLAWRLMVRSGTVSGRAAFAQLHVNSNLLGVYVNVEQVDKRFLETRFGDDTGWLYKKSGGSGDGLKTHEIDGLQDPYADYFCFWAAGSSCPTPSDAELAETLPEHLDIPQLLRHGAVNAYMANTDALLFKDNNYYWYDWAGRREYLPWDLDTAMKDDVDVFSGGVGGQTDAYTSVLFANWDADYEAILTELVTDILRPEVVEAELDRAGEVAGVALDADPYATGTTGGAIDELKAYWAERHLLVLSQLEAH